MTPKKSELTPKAVNRWLEALRRKSLQGTDAATKYQIQYMFRYIEELVKYQEVMPPKVEEDKRFFTCTRCNNRLEAESGTAEDYTFCPLCGQRWKDDEQRKNNNGNA